MGVRCYLLEPADIVYVYLRRYHSSEDATNNCPAGSYHNAMVKVGEETPIYETRETNNHPYTVRVDSYDGKYEQLYPHGHLDWPKKCDKCLFQFSNDDPWQIFTDLMYKNPRTDELVSIRNPPDGAMYYAWWLKDNPRYPDTGPLYVICPGGHPWNIDSRASNCTMPNDDEHRCWIRHGEPPKITVDKNGLTCAAGAGSIMAGNYHGFLINGEFT